ncbi:hypothetical protein EVAR_31263_1 [Eumeta japonica]|uniref:Uncharacterized protein n=1 Tax=Eumeta variegata TaxID=151549 RepID=A0A4C1VZA1_EUMVA|nr:hypothetical protein EVAR_31263_1 [Eumeta japonica]
MSYQKLATNTFPSLTIDQNLKRNDTEQRQRGFREMTYLEGEEKAAIDENKATMYSFAAFIKRKANALLSPVERRELHEKRSLRREKMVINQGHFRRLAMLSSPRLRVA